MVPYIHQKIEKKKSKDIFILSLPLHVNYGGVLQSYALIKVLNKLGYNAKLIQCIPTNEILPRRILAIIKYFVNRFFYLFPSIKKSYYLDFKKKYIPQQSFLFNWQLNKLNKKNIHAIIVGSDQVWNNYKPKRIYNYFLSFIHNPNIIKISYAASFGKEIFPGDKQTLQVCSQLIKSFKGVSVREKSGVTICKEQLNKLDAKHVLDPTLLLTQDDYNDLLTTLPTNIKQQYIQKKYLFSYLLGDNTSANEKFIKNLCNTLKIGNKGILPIKSIKLLLQKKHSNISIEEWIYSIRESSFVVCNSFHACVFSIIFHKDFIVLPCHGINRIYELLELCGIENRIITDYNLNTALELLNKKINWDNVDETIKLQREKSINFITNNLN